MAAEFNDRVFPPDSDVRAQIERDLQGKDVSDQLVRLREALGVSLDELSIEPALQRLGAGPCPGDDDESAEDRAALGTRHDFDAGICWRCGGARAGWASPAASLSVSPAAALQLLAAGGRRDDGNESKDDIPA